MFVDKCVFSQGALAEICTGSVKNLVRYGAMHQLGNYAIHDVHIVAYLMTRIPINNDKGRCQKKTDLFGILSQTMGRWVQVQVQSRKLFSENIHSVIFTANIQKCPKTCNTYCGEVISGHFMML